MLDVYICEDVLAERKMMERSIEAAIMMYEYDMKIRVSTSDPQEIINQLKRSKNTGIYFLDIHLEGEKNGLALAEEIREYDPRGFIVFITSHSEMAVMTFQYKVEAMDFILKDQPEQIQRRISECLENANKKFMNITRGIGKTMTVMKGEKRLTLQQDEIMFFETSVNEHKLYVHTANKSIEFFGKIKDIEAQAGDGFVRCHRSYLLNKKNIEEVDYAKKVIKMKNGAECPIAVRMLKRVKEQMD